MKAVRFHTTGEPEVLIYEDVPDLTPKDGEVLIKSWWETWWRPEKPWPTLIFVTNDPRQATWSKEREKKLLGRAMHPAVSFVKALQGRSESRGWRQASRAADNWSTNNS